MNKKFILNQKRIIRIFILLLSLGVFIASFLFSYRELEKYNSFKELIAIKKKGQHQNEINKKNYKEPVRISEKQDYKDVMKKISQLSYILSPLQVVSVKTNTKKIKNYFKEEINLEMITTYNELLLFLKELESDYPVIYWEGVEIKIISYPKINVKLALGFINK